MKKIDKRFSDSNMDMLRNMIGKKMLKLKCDAFLFSTSVYGIVGISMEDHAYAFTNLVEVNDYFGQDEDVAMFKMERMDFEDIHSMIQGQEMIIHPVESIVSNVYVVNEQQLLFKNDIQIYEIWVTRGVIFKFDDTHEISLEKNIWFSEDISVEKGYNLLQRFTAPTEFEESWSGEYRGTCLRDVINITG